MSGSPIRQLHAARPGGATAVDSKSADPASAGLEQRLSQLIRIEGELRACSDRQSLWQHLVNESAVLLPFGQSLVLEKGEGETGRWRVAAIAGLSAVNRDSPMLRWYEVHARSLSTSAGMGRTPAAPRWRRWRPGRRTSARNWRGPAGQARIGV